MIGGDRLHNFSRDFDTDSTAIIVLNLLFLVQINALIVWKERFCLNILHTLNTQLLSKCTQLFYTSNAMSVFRDFSIHVQKAHYKC